MSLLQVSAFYSSKLIGNHTYYKANIQKQPSSGVLCKRFSKNFSKFTGKQLPETYDFTKKETLTQVFFSKFCHIFKITFLYSTSGGCF